MSRYSSSLLLSCDKNLYFLDLLQSFSKQYTISKICCTHIENKQTFRYACNVSAYLLQCLQEPCHLRQTFNYACSGLAPILLQWFVFHMVISQPSNFPIQILYLLSEIIKVICTRETGRKASMWRNFIACFAVSTNKFYSYWQCIYKLCLSCNVKTIKNNSQILLKRAERSGIQIFFKDVLCHVSAAYSSFNMSHWYLYTKRILDRGLK